MKYEMPEDIKSIVATWQGYYGKLSRFDSKLVYGGLLSRGAAEVGRNTVRIPLAAVRTGSAYRFDESNAKYFAILYLYEDTLKMLGLFREKNKRLTLEVNPKSLKKDKRRQMFEEPSKVFQSLLEQQR